MNREKQRIAWMCFARDDIDISTQVYKNYDKQIPLDQCMIYLPTFSLFLISIYIGEYNIH